MPHQDGLNVQASRLAPIVLAVVFSLNGTRAAAQSDSELLDLELEALLELPVSVASARPEALRETPVVVSRIDADEARRYGLRTLAEWLSLLPGVVVQDSAIGTEAVMVRGLVEGFNQKVLFLLDGVPYWQPSHGDIPLSAIPLELIQHVELVRGPGGILFGTNATAGVINVVTRRDRSRQAAVSAGSHGNWRTEGYWHPSEGPLTGLTFAVSASEGPEYEGAFTARPVLPTFPPGTPRDGRVARDKRQLSAFVSWRNETTGVRWHGFESESEGLAAAATILNASRLQYRGQQLVGDHVLTLSSKGQLRAVVDLTQFSLSIPTDRQINGLVDATQTFAGNAGDNQRIRSGLHWQYALRNESFLQAGFEREVRRHGEYFVIERPSGNVLAQQMAAGSTGESAFYAQADVSHGDWRAVLGARHVQSNAFDNATLPRGSILWQVSPNQTWRLVFAKGYNTPTPIQRFVQVAPNALRGNPHLDAETIGNLELAWSWQGAGQSLTVTGYRLDADHAIRRIRPPGTSTVTFINLSAFQRHGIETEWRLQRDGWQAYASAHWQREGRSNNDEFSLFSPRWQTSIGGSYLRGAHQWGASLRHIGRRAAADAINLLALQYRYSVGAWELEANIANALGDDQQHADVQDLVGDRLVPSGPSSPMATLGLRWRF